MTMGDECEARDQHTDDYASSIEISNTCRKFYFHHVKTTEEFKKTVQRSRCCTERRNGAVRSRLDVAMDKLRNEMAELMDQDLSLMEQLLTLNDKIEEMKHKCMYSVSKDSLGTSSCDLSTYCDYTDSAMSLTSLDINDYNENCFLGSETDLRITRLNDLEDDDVFESDEKSERTMADDKEILSKGANLQVTPADLDTSSTDFKEVARANSEGFSTNGLSETESHTETNDIGIKQSDTVSYVSVGDCMAYEQAANVESSPKMNLCYPKSKQDTHILIKSSSLETHCLPFSGIDFTNNTSIPFADIDKVSKDPDSNTFFSGK